jgi:hypothetical protein
LAGIRAIGRSERGEHFLRHRPPVPHYFKATVEWMKILACVCGHASLNQFCAADLTTWKRDIAYFTGINYAGVVPL